MEERGDPGNACVFIQNAGSCDRTVKLLTYVLERFPAAHFRMAARLLVVSAVANAVLAYSNTVPVVAWSSSQYVPNCLPFKVEVLTTTQFICP
jgi:hypothetical protein